MRSSKLLLTGAALTGAILTGAAVLLTAGCASTSPAPEPPSQAEQDIAATRAEAAASEAEARERAGDDEPVPRQTPEPGDEPLREKIVVVDPGGRASEPTARELSEANRARAGRSGDGERGSGKRLTNENLAEIASQGKITFADKPANEPSGEGDGNQEGEGEGGNGAGEGATAEDCGEVCWRRRARELRQAWADTVASIDELEDRVADLRWRFYATDDPWVRDNRVKPAWDRALDRLRRAREEASRYAERVDELMQAGRRAGALPGWLREGSELEPEWESGEDERRRAPADPVEPDVMEGGHDSVEPTEDPGSPLS